MSEFSNSKRALGFFWPKDKPENRWAGELYIDGFPKVRVLHLDGQPGYGNHLFRNKQTFFGRTETNEHVTLIGASGHLLGSAINAGGTAGRWQITASFLLVTYHKHFDETSAVKRLQFSSAAAERVLNLKADPFYRDMPKRRNPLGEPPTFQRHTASYIDLLKRVRFRIFRPRVPSLSSDPLSFFTVDFLDGATSQEAMVYLFDLRRLLTLICGCQIDLCDVHLHFEGEGGHHIDSEVYFFDQIPSPTKNAFLPHTHLLSISTNRDLFKRVMRTFLHEEDARKIGRGAFASIVEEGDSLHLNHLRELVTIIEMQAQKSGMTPLPTKDGRELKTILLDALTNFALAKSDRSSWEEVIKKRIENINTFDGKKRLAKFVDSLPRGFVSVPSNFCVNVIDLRNILVHDISKLTSSDYNKLIFFVIKLQAIYALNDAIALGANSDEILKPSRFMSRAAQVNEEMFEN